MPAIRKHIGRIAVFTALLTLTGVYGYYYAREWMAKWAFAHQTVFGIDELILIAVPQAELSRNAFLTNQEEFLWEGEMVDVLHREVRSDTLFIYGFRDAAETELKHEAAWLYPDTTQSDSLPDAGTKRVKWFSPFVKPEATVLTSVGVVYLVNRQQFFLSSSPRIGLPLPEVPSPPPDLRCI